MNLLVAADQAEDGPCGAAGNHLSLMINLELREGIMRDPFHDLHHQEATITSHIRLISEGGSSHAGSLELVCIDSIHATQTCTTESQHSGYRSATACNAATPLEVSLCSIGVEHAEELDEKLIPEVLRQRLERLGNALGDGAKVSVRQPGRLWSLQDAQRNFSVRRLSSRIAVYPEPES